MERALASGTVRTGDMSGLDIILPCIGEIGRRQAKIEILGYDVDAAADQSCISNQMTSNKADSLFKVHHYLPSCSDELHPNIKMLHQPP